MNNSPQNAGLSSSHQGLSSHFLNRIQNEDVPVDHGWLSGKFSKLPFQLYRIWLVVTLCIVLYVNYHTLLFFWSELKNAYSFFLQEMESYEPTTATISCIFLFFGCYEMFSAIERQKSEMAQKSILKFQYSLGLLLIGSLTFMIWQKFVFKYYSTIALLVTFALPTISAVNLIGGLAVLKAFQMNHPLVRQCAPQASEDQIVGRDDLLAQNQVIAFELLRFDLQLESWSYLIYKWWLKFAVVLEIMMIPQNMVFQLSSIWRDWQVKQVLAFLLPFLAHFMGAYCSYDMEVVLRTRMLTRSKRALSQLKICLLLSTVFSVVTPFLATKKHDFVFEEYLNSLLLNARNFVLIPFITFIGAFMANRVIEERDHYVRVSTFVDDSYDI